MRRTGPAREIPPPLELECLKALWRLGEGSVKDVRMVVTENRNLAYTTVMTVLDRLSRRGGVARRKVGRAFIYAPVFDAPHLRDLAVQELADSFFGGSRQTLLAYLLDSAGNGLGEPAVRPAAYDTNPGTDSDRLDASLL